MIRKAVLSSYSPNNFFTCLLFLLTIALLSCNGSSKSDDDSSTLFQQLPSTVTGIDFSNDVKYSQEFNAYTFRNFYNGGGVGIADINNDSLPDLFFCGNMKSNKLYINKGNFQFEDITDKAGLNSEGVWSTGVTFADVNGDGLLDIYVCKSGDFKGKNRSNALYINNGNLTFTDKAKEYGLNNMGLSTHAVFFDYDNDNDLDCYLLNNSFKSVGNFDLVKDQRKIVDSLGGNKLYRNDGDIFKDVTAEAGIYSSKIGFGLGVTISDINKDGWQDIYVSNDFFERDYLYINQKDGHFAEMLEDCITELSLNSMGADIADINNDGLPDIYVTDMLPELEARVKTKTNFENWEKYQSNLKNGYGHQFVRNVLQLNRGTDPSAINSKVHFSEIGRMANVYATDWSWGALITDFDNDGYKDIFVANGIFKDLTDQDYIQYTANPVEIRKILKDEKEGIKKLIDLMPSNPIANYAFHNNGNLSFTNKAKEWGLGEPGFSNGSAYGDLDNDGDLDLVVNNVNMPCFVYKNKSRETTKPDNHFLKVVLKGIGKNVFAIGADVTIYHDNGIKFQEAMPMRGFESTVDSRLNFGLGNTKKIDSVVIRWPNGEKQVVKDISPDQTIYISQKDGKTYLPAIQLAGPLLLQKSDDNFGIDFEHKENEFVDFDRDRLIYQMLSTEGPRTCVGDINGDGKEDIYFCGAKDQPGALYIQSPNAHFVKSNEKLLEIDKGSEDTDCTFFDADGDGDKDLFVCSGGSEFSPNSTALISRLYINDGKGHFSKSTQLFPSSQLFESSSCVTAADFDHDGDADLFIGVRSKPFSYGYPCKGYILQNDGKGIFKDITNKIAPVLETAGMVTDAKWTDFDNDGWLDLVIIGEYMPVRLFHNEKGLLKEVTNTAGFENSNGWWKRIVAADINGDGFLDFITGNQGLNTKFKASKEKPIHLYIGDFDQNGSFEQVLTCYNGDRSYPVALRHDLVEVLPYLKKKYLRYDSYKEQGIEDIFTKEQLSKAVQLDANELQSVVWINNKNGTFTKQVLPIEAQMSPVYGIAAGDYNNDDQQDLLLGGNFYESKPESGIYDASNGLLLIGDGKGKFLPQLASNSGFFIKGAVRDINSITVGKKKLIIVSSNNNKAIIFK